ncbi:MAG: hypothetical protein FJX57_06040 [Alphaproteobacteria bacterium]|nr:hypothetical protein [Alphaproteobacteria bacterium]
MPQLDVRSILAKSYRDLARHPRLYASLASVPLVASISSNVFAPPAPPSEDLGATLLHLGGSLAASIFCFVLSLPTATAWHRLVVLGPRHPRANLAYRFGVEERAYVRQAFGLMLLATPVALLAGAMLALFLAVTGEGDATTSITRSFWFTMVLQAAAVALVAPRFILLPGTAIGQRTRLRDARTLLRMNYGRMRGLVLLAWLPQAAFVAIIELMPGPPIAISIAKIVVSFVFLAIGVGVLSHAYLWLTGRVVVVQNLRGA